MAFSKVCLVSFHSTTLSFLYYSVLR
jgi:hypothetical protein